jgi:polyhydroxyalkanoate synthase
MITNILKKVEDYKEISLKHQKRVKNIIALKNKKISHTIAPTPFEILGKNGRCNLLYFKPKCDQGKNPIFITPSIINKYYILDLMDGMSLIQYLTESNTPVYLIDWGVARTIDRQASIEDHILTWLDWGIKKSCTHAKLEKIDLFGQCIGGTFCTIYTAIHPELVNSLILLTTPIDFHDDGLLSIWANKSKIDIEMLGRVWGNIYRGFLKESFQYLKPLDRIKKYHHLYSHSWDENFLNKYMAIDFWVNDCIDIPGSTYVKYIQEFYQQNLLVKGELNLENKKVDLKNIQCPLFVITSNEDNIVSSKSALAILNCVSSKIKKTSIIPGGHIGLLLSSKAKERFWSPISDWIEKEV